jgi:hypothetical protein
MAKNSGSARAGQGGFRHPIDVEYFRAIPVGGEISASVWLLTTPIRQSGRCAAISADGLRSFSGMVKSFRSA